VSGYAAEYFRVKNSLFDLVNAELQMLDVFTGWADLEKDDIETSLQRFRCRRMLDALELLGLKESFEIWREDVLNSAYEQQRLA